MAEKIITNSAEETKELAAKLVAELKTGAVITLEGDLGAGKTTFAQGVGEALGIKRMTSPTYTLIRDYPVEEKGFGIDRLYHIDLYRLETAEEVFQLGLNELWFSPKHLLLIEWPEKTGGILPTPRIEIKIKKMAGDKREIEINR